MQTLDDLWAEAESIAKAVHLDKVGNGKYLAQLNRQACICDRCSVEVSADTAAGALRKVIDELNTRPLHV